jgi:hypothetical protein
VDRRSDLPALKWRLARAMVSRDQQNDPFPSSDCLVQPPVNRCPRPVEVQSVQIDDSIRLDRSAAKLLVPASIEGALADRHSMERALRRQLYRRPSECWFRDMGIIDA